MHSRIIFLLTALYLSSPVFSQQIIRVDICVYGGTSAGVIAAYTATKLGKSVLLVEPGRRLGGLTSGGLGYTDIGNKFAVSGLALDFYRRIGKHYGKFEQWIFEPKVAEAVFKQYIKEGNVKVLYSQRIVDAWKEQNSLRKITTFPAQWDPKLGIHVT